MFHDFFRIQITSLKQCLQAWIRQRLRKWASSSLPPSAMKRRKRGVDSTERRMATSPEPTGRKILFETKTKNSPRQRGLIERSWIFGSSMLRNWRSNNCWLFPSFTADPENGFQHYKTFEGCEAPSHDMVKQFIRWLAKSTSGRLSENKEPTVRSAQAWAEQFFGGFAEFTKTVVIPEDRTEIYQVSPSLYYSNWSMDGN